MTPSTMPLAEVEARHSPAERSAVSRIGSIDWVKGALVVFMVVYHAMNYSAFRPLAFKFLAFLPPSFILIAGYLVGQVYITKYDLSSLKPYVRLALRGTKLLLIFTLLNLGYRLLSAPSLFDGWDEFCTRAGITFISGNSRASIFEVLLPIAYFLLLAPMLLWFRFRVRSFISVTAVCCFVGCVLLQARGSEYKNLELLSAGIIGMALGAIPIQSVDRVARNWLVVLAVYLGYRMLSYAFGDTYALQMIAAAVTVLLLYSIALHLGDDPWISQQLILLGRYSLLAYLVQIGLLQVMVRIMHKKAGHSWEVVGLVIATVLSTYAVVLFVHKLRKLSLMAGVAYNVVFA
jgi:hypothetical protein